jgi:asparagine N-glycosylation enzyme membrane subunit Stt3
MRRRATWLPLLLLALLGALALTLRCLHLLKGGHYYILSMDSYYFHRIAELIASGQSYYYPTQARVLPYLLESGLAYPLGLLARLITLVSNASTSEALTLVGKGLPPAIAVANLVLIYTLASRMYGRFVGLLSAFAWAIMATAVSIGAAGYLDRDGLSILLITTAVTVLYLMRGMRLVRRGFDFAWVLQGTLLLLFVGLLYLEWGFMGPLILMAILISFIVAEVLADIWRQLAPTMFGESDIMTLPLVLTREAAKGLPSAIRRSTYKPVALALCMSAIVAAIKPGWDVLAELVVETLHGSVGGTQNIGELQGTGPGDVLAYGVLIPPILIALVVAVMRRRNADMLWLSWFVVLFIGGLFARRLFLYVVPATSVLAGIGFAAMTGGVSRGLSPSHFVVSVMASDMATMLKYARVFCAIGLMALGIVIAVPSYYGIGDAPGVSVRTEWNDAFTWLRNETPEESVVMTWWDFGYWIMDVAQRVPVVDNGRHVEQRDKDIARVYCTTDDAEAVSLVNHYGADYLVFSTLEISILPLISELDSGNKYGDGLKVAPELQDSLFGRAMAGRTDFGAGLRRVYPDPATADPSVVILALEE